MSILFLASWALINALRIDQQGVVNNFAMAWQIITTIVTIGCVVGIPSKDPDVPSDWVWNTEYTGVGVPDSAYGYIYFIGLLSALFAFSGYEAGAHLAEETQNASVSAPWGIIATCCSVAATGFIYIVGMLYATPTVLGPYAEYWPTAFSVINASMACVSPDTPGCGMNDYLSTAIATVADSGAPGVYIAACGEKTGMFLLASA